MPLISVIVPVYKVEQYLHRCVDSILRQTFTDFQLILVDDGSPDRCGALCEEYAQKDSRIAVIHQANGGLSAARNTGIDWALANSDSQWLFFVDSDDFIHPDSLQVLLDAAQSHGTDISIGGFARTPGTAPEVCEKDLTAQQWDTKELFLKHNVNAVVAWGKLYRKALWGDLRYPVGKLHEDEFTTYKLLFRCQKLSYIPAPLYGYFVNEAGIMGAAWSPRRMDGVEAFRQRLDYFRAMGDGELLRYAAVSYVNHAAHQYEQAVDYPEQRRHLQKALGKALRRNRRLLPPKDFGWIYAIAFPRRTLLLRRLSVWK